MRLTWRRPLRAHDVGSTSSIGLAVAAGTLAMGFLAAHIMVSIPPGQDARTELYDGYASIALDQIVRQPGLTTSQKDWGVDPDKMSRFGLASDGSPNFLDFTKIRALRNGTFSNDPANAKPDYPEVRAALGIKDLDIHLRTYPVLVSVDDPRWTKEPHGRYAYVGHDTGAAAAPAAADVTTTRTTSGNILNVSVTIRNDGTTPYTFAATIGIGTMGAGNTLVSEERHTKMLNPGASETVHVNFHRMAYTGSPNGVRVSVDGANGIQVYAPTWFSATMPSTGTTHAYGVKLSAGAKYYLVGEDVKFHADRYEGNGNQPNSAMNLRFVLVGHDGKEWFNNTLNLPKKKTATYECTNCTTPGVYTGFFYNADMSQRARDHIVVLTTAPVSGATVFSGIAAKEIELIGKLVEEFEPSIYDEDTNAAGDIFDDGQKVRDLPDVLSRYSTLIVGSEVSQTALNSGDIKWDIADWVLAGGNLVVLGRSDGHANWLQPVYKASIAGAGGGIGAPDPSHPILVTPNRLEYYRYNDHGLAWGIDEDQPFTHVLTRGVSGGESQDVISVSNPGAYNNGSVVLTSYLAGALTTPQDDQEAMRFLSNLLSQSHTMLFLDFGPPVPPGVPVGSSQRLVAVPHPNVPGAVVETRIVLYVFG